MRRLFKVIGIAVALGACTTINGRYLDDAKGTAGQAEIVKTLGQPAKKQTLDNGETQWVYHKRHYSSVGARNVCQVFELRFDAQTVLKDWEDHEVDCNAEAM